MTYITTVTVTSKRMDELEKAEAILNALYAGGVDNWVWYEESLDQHLEEKWK